MEAARLEMGIVHGGRVSCTVGRGTCTGGRGSCTGGMGIVHDRNGAMPIGNVDRAAWKWRFAHWKWHPMSADGECAPWKWSRRSRQNLEIRKNAQRITWKLLLNFQSGLQVTATARGTSSEITDRESEWSYHAYACTTLSRGWPGVRVRPATPIQTILRVPN